MRILNEKDMANKIDLMDVTFLIPLRLDSIDRLENLLEVIDFLIRNFQANIHVLEVSKYNNLLLKKLLPKKVDYFFEQDYDNVFHRTFYIKRMAQRSHTAFIAVWDADVIVTKEQIIQTIELLRKNEADFVFPYEGKLLDISPIMRELYFKTKNINVLKENEKRMKPMYAPDPVGGGFFAKREMYIKAGCENENFYGWGLEDGERRRRWVSLGYILKRIPGYMYHFTHERGMNSQFHSSKQQTLKVDEYQRIALMSKVELEEEIKSWQ